MESQKRQEKWIQNVSTNITFIDYGNSCVGHRKAGFQIKIAVHFGMADYGDGFRTACVCSDESGNFGCRLVSDCRTCIGMCSRSYDWNLSGTKSNVPENRLSSQHLRSHWEHFLLSRWYSAWYFTCRIFRSIWRLFLEESLWRLRRHRHYRSSESLIQKDQLPEH